MLIPVLVHFIPETYSLVIHPLQVLISRQPPGLMLLSLDLGDLCSVSSSKAAWPKEVIYAICKRQSKITALYLLFHKATQEIYEKSISVAAEL